MPSLLEDPHYEATIRRLDQTDLVQASPVVATGADRPIAGGAITLPHQYVLNVVVKEAGGAGAALTAGVDYSVNLRTGVITVLGGGALASDAEAWVSYEYDGVDNIALRQLTNRTAALKADVVAILEDISVIEGVIGSLDVVPSTRQVIAGAGLTGGGALSGNVTLNAAADADGSIVVASDSLKVGVLASDAQHGARGRGSQHTNATEAESGFMSAADKTAFDRLAIGAVRLMYFGFGEDGDVVINSGTTVLTRDMYYRNLTLSGTGKINTNGWTIYVSDTLDISAAAAGAIFNTGGAGGDATNSTGVTSGSVGAAGAVAPGNTVGAGAAGVTGAVAGGSNSIGNVGLGITTGYGGGHGGDGGSGGNPGSGTSLGAAAQTSNGVVTSVLLGRLLAFLAQAPSNTNDATAPATPRICGGASGASGSGGGGISTSGNKGGPGGGSGAGGGVVCIFARRLNRGASTATGCITANGGNGGNGAKNGTDNTAGAGGGGGGGGGGLVMLFVGEFVGTQKAGAITANGGNGGNGGVTGGTGVNGGGAQGANGGRAVVVDLATGTVTTTNGSAGAAGSGTAGGAGGALSAAA